MATTAHASYRRLATAAAAALLALLVPAAAGTAAGPVPTEFAVPGLDPGLQTLGEGLQRVVVTGGAGLAAAVRRAGGQVTQALPIVDGVAASVPAHRLPALAADPAVTAVTADRSARFEQLLGGLVGGVVDTVGGVVDGLLGTSSAGAGVGVAVLDTGVSPMPDLVGRLVHGPDLSGEGTTIDSYGHGTAMAGIIAGSGADSVNRDGGRITGVAPGAHVVAVKVAGRNGAVDVSTLLQGMHWISAYRQQFGIRVLNLSWGVPSTQDPALDPLNLAVERLWGEGITVVVAAGNSGPTKGTVTKPGDDPVVITAGALDRGSSDLPTDDSVPQWSSRGPSAAGVGKPDVVAPGRMVLSLRSYGSHIEQANPSALIAPSYIRGSGTSQASAHVAGVAAVLIGARPWLTPDQVKEVLVTTALPVAGVSSDAQGAGRVQATQAAAAVPVGLPQQRPATGLGSIEASRGGLHVIADCGGVATEIRGEIDVRCQPWDAQTWSTSEWTGDAWTGVSWKGAEWTGVSWKDVAWSDATWTGVSWKDGTWTGPSWQGSAWTGAASGPWTGVSWKSPTWSAVSWRSADWAGVSWRGTYWSSQAGEFQTAFWGKVPPVGVRLPGEPFLSGILGGLFGR